MSDDTLLGQVQRSLCCPHGCRALAEGVVKDCAAPQTKEHAQAAIDLVTAAYRDKIRALVKIRDQAVAAADSEEPVGRVAFRSLAKLASDALA